MRGGVAQPLAAVSRRLGQVSGWAERVVGWLEFWALARCVGMRAGRGQSPKPSHCGLGCGGVRWNGWSFWLWLVALESAVEEVKAKSPAIAGQPATKIPKIPKIPIALDDSGEFKRLP